MSASTFTLAGILEAERDRIVSRFVDEVQRTGLSPEGASRPLLVDHIPAFLEEVVEDLRMTGQARVSMEVTESSKSAAQHGVQRWAIGLDLQGLIREYGILRHCILAAANEAGLSLSIEEFDILARCLNVGVAVAAEHFARVREAETTAKTADLVYLAESGALLSSASLDFRSTFARLADIVIPRLADWCGLYIDGEDPTTAPVAHVDPTRIDLLREVFQRRELAEICRRVVESGRAFTGPDAAPDMLAGVASTPEDHAFFRSVGMSSWVAVPLRVEGNVFGALVLAYGDSSRHHDAHDQLLAKEIATRAGIAVDNARLYELSQRERARVEAATRVKDEFIAMVSHELRTPLNAVLGWARLIHSGSLPEDKREYALDTIVRNAEAQSRLVDDLLDVSKVITGTIRLSLAQLDLRSVIELAVEDVRSAAEAKRIEIVADLQGVDAHMRGDADRLRQVTWNLLANAVKFTPKSGVVRIALRRIDSDLELDVTDTGHGIEPSFLPHVFESFTQADTGAARRYGGLGIGLSIVRHIVELHGGQIRVESEGSSRGSRFVVRLPVSSLVSTTVGVSRVPSLAQVEDAPDRNAAAGLKVLVVDDEADARELVAFVLEGCGAEVHVASGGESALVELETFKAHVIVSDIGMAEMDGLTLIRSVRTHDSADIRSVPAIALTAFSGSELRNKALVSGFNVQLTKPVEPALLVRAVIDLARSVRRS